MSDTIEIIHIDITKLTVDAIVNAANNSLTGGGGVDGAIHKAAGESLREFCHTLKGCKTGHAKISPGFKLPSRFVIHTVGPVWNNGTAEEESLLSMCYKNSLQLAVENKIRSIAFPAIGTGAYRFPFEKAGLIALKTIDHFLKNNDSIDKIYLVVFSEKELKNYKKIFRDFYR